MNKNKLDLVLDLYKDEKITKDQAWELLNDNNEIGCPYIPINPVTPSQPWYPNPYPFGPIVTYATTTDTNYNSGK